MSAPDNPYASPPREQEAGQAPEQPSRPQPETPRPPWGSAPPPAPGTPPAGAAPSLGRAALVAGGLAVLLGITVYGGVLLGALAIGLGIHAHQASAERGRRDRSATGGVLLGLLGLVVAAGTHFLLLPLQHDYEACLRASTSPAMDHQCKVERDERLSRR